MASSRICFGQDRSENGMARLVSPNHCGTVGTPIVGFREGTPAMSPGRGGRTIGRMVLVKTTGVGGSWIDNIYRYDTNPWRLEPPLTYLSSTPCRANGTD